MPHRRSRSRWMGTVLVLAGLHNLVWGAWAVLTPVHSFEWSGMKRDDVPLPYPQLWQGIGMMVAIFGLGYLIAATDAIRHWPIVLVGLLMKIAGPIGCVIAAFQGEMPWSGLAMTLVNDVIWWVPFVLILRRAYQTFRREEEAPPAKPLARFIDSLPVSDGRTLAETQGPVLLVFLRHFGCIFCREALADLARQREAIRATGTKLMFVHMSTSEEADAFLARYGLADVPHISDPECELYRAIGLERGTLGQLLGWRSWWRGTGTFFRRRHGVGRFVGDIFRMPGVFLVERGRVVRAFRHRSVADRPDYVALTHCPVPTVTPEAYKEVS